MASAAALTAFVDADRLPWPSEARTKNLSSVVESLTVAEVPVVVATTRSLRITS